MRHLVIAETDRGCGGLITLGDLWKENHRCEDGITVQNGKLKCNQKPSCNGVFSAENITVTGILDVKSAILFGQSVVSLMGVFRCQIVSVASVNSCCRRGLD